MGSSSTQSPLSSLQWAAAGKRQPQDFTWRSMKLLYRCLSKVIPRRMAHTTKGRTSMVSGLTTIWTIFFPGGSATSQALGVSLML